MLSKFEIVGIGISVLFMALALYLIRVETSFLSLSGEATQVAQVAGLVVVGEGEDVTAERTNALVEAMDVNGNLKKLVIDDIKVGTGKEVEKGDTVDVHYIGTLPNGQEFDNSHKRGEVLTFTVGDGRVIQGWDQGLIGMKVGGQRILVIPPELGYGSRVMGPIPADSTLVFAIELVAIK